MSKHAKPELLFSHFSIQELDSTLSSHISHSVHASEVLALRANQIVGGPKGGLCPASTIKICGEKLTDESLISFAIDALYEREEKWLAELADAQKHSHKPQLPKPIGNLLKYSVDFARKQNGCDITQKYFDFGITQTKYFRDSDKKYVSLKAVHSIDSSSKNSHDDEEDCDRFNSIVSNLESDSSEKEERYKAVAGSFLETLLDALAGPRGVGTLEGLAEVIPELKGKTHRQLVTVFDKILDNIHLMREAGLLFDNDEDAVRAGVLSGLKFRTRAKINAEMGV